MNSYVKLLIQVLIFIGTLDLFYFILSLPLRLLHVVFFIKRKCIPLANKKKILIFLDEYILLINEGTFFPFESLVVEPRQPIS